LTILVTYLCPLTISFFFIFIVILHLFLFFFFFFFNDTPTTEIYTLSLHDALPICGEARPRGGELSAAPDCELFLRSPDARCGARSEEHTSELQSPCNLVCRLLLEKKKKKKITKIK